MNQSAPNTQNGHTNHTTAKTSSPPPHGQASADRGNGPSAGLREAAEKGVSNLQAAYGRVRTANEEASGVFHDTYGIVGSYITAVSLKGLDAAKSNVDASFDFFRQLLAAKTISEAVALQAAYAQQMFDSLRVQMTEFQGSAQKAAVDATEPSRTAWEKGMNPAAVKPGN